MPFHPAAAATASKLQACSAALTGDKYAECSMFMPCLYTQVPWSKLGQEPVIVEFDRLYILAGPKAETDQPATSQVKQGSAAGFDSQLC